MEMIWKELAVQGELFLRLLAACILGCAIGFERKNRNKGAGMRTHTLVCLGAALMMIISKYGFQDTPGSDGSRMASQVVSGIGFLGAGIIFVRNNSISGVTTAAGIRVASGVGMAVGAGQYFIAVSSALLMIGAQIVMHRVRFLAQEPYRCGLRITCTHSSRIMQELEELLKKEKIEVVSMQVKKEKGKETRIEMEIIYPGGYDKLNLLETLQKQEAILSVRG